MNGSKSFVRSRARGASPTFWGRRCGGGGGRLGAMEWVRNCNASDLRLGERIWRGLARFEEELRGEEWNGRVRGAWSGPAGREGSSSPSGRGDL